MRHFSDKRSREKKQTSFYPVTFFPENHAIYEITWKNIVELDRPQMTI